MISLFMEFALFLLVLFVVVPGVMVFLMARREIFHVHPKAEEWHKHSAAKLLN